jgi:hypothetical protein
MEKGGSLFGDGRLYYSYTSLTLRAPPSGQYQHVKAKDRAAFIQRVKMCHGAEVQGTLSDELHFEAAVWWVSGEFDLVRFRGQLHLHLATLVRRTALMLEKSLPSCEHSILVPIAKHARFG